MEDDPETNTDSDSEVGGDGLFNEPSDFYQAEKPPTFVDFDLKDGRKLNLRLVGHNPLWGHHLWNSGRVLADYFQDHPELVQGKEVLELGAGAGLPGLVAGVLGARKVVITDYPDQELVDNLQFNIDKHEDLLDGNVTAEGYLWGAPSLRPKAPGSTDGFDVIILGDLLFNHSEHEKLLRSIYLNLRAKDDSRALVFFTPYRPWLLEKDLAFFDLAKGSFDVTKIFETVLPEVMFKEDRGDELLRRTVFGYELRFSGGETNFLQH